ncbi:MAG: MATE family efflux transporter [Dorea sp.]|nr:MATE family efflux transporter [Dorea sp.]
MNRTNSTQPKPAENKMGVMPEGKLLLNMALPMMASMLVLALYNIVDSIFVSRICEDALTAVSMAFPMQNLMIGCSTGLGVGTNALVSRALGEKNQKNANEIARQGLLLTVCSSLLFLVIGLTCTRSFFQMQNASPAITEYGVQYLTIVMTCSFGVFFQMIFERLLQATGRTLITMFTQGLGAIINIVLDPIFIFGYFGVPEMGIAGAAVATVAGQIIAGFMAMICNIKMNTDVRIHLKGFRPSGRIIKTILKIGIPSVIMVAIGSIMTFTVNKILNAFSSTAVAVFGVYFKLQSFAFMPIFGMNNGMIPIIGYNYGARNPKRMLNTVKYGVIYAESILLTFMIIAQLIPDKMLSLFKASEQMLSIGIPAMRIITLSFLVAGFSVISSSYFQALGFSFYSMLISVVRQLVFLVPLAFLFSRTGNVNMVWWAWPLAEIASIALCIYYHLKIKHKILDPMMAVSR